jgi:hypothetical protein
MKTEIKTPQKEYPYLAIWVGLDQYLTEKQISEIRPKDIVIISLVQNSDEIAKQPFVQHLLGGSEGGFTNSESDYCPLPIGFSITLSN